MLKEILRTEVALIEYDADVSLMLVKSLPSPLLKEDELKKVLLEISEFVKQLKPKLYMSDQIDMQSPFFVSLQEWIAKLFAQTFVEIGLKKHAVVLSQDIFSAISMEQTIEEARKVALPHKTLFFENKDKAMKWLLEN